MKENKYGIIVSFLFTALSLFGAIFFTNSWWQNFSFSILGGSLCSLIIFTFNYFVQMKRCAEEIVIDIYKVSSCGYGSLFSEKEDKTIEKIFQALSILDDKVYDVYIKNYNLLNGTFIFDPRRKIVKVVQYKIDILITKIFDIQSYIEIFGCEAKNNTKKLYKVIDELTSCNCIYLQALKVAKSFFSDISSLEEVCDAYKIKKARATRFKKSL